MLKKRKTCNNHEVFTIWQSKSRGHILYGILNHFGFGKNNNTKAEKLYQRGP